ncbi:MAG TPA: ABC transporter family substrate-binding protein [Actinomycetes bacterium]|nr:ABC transporter family substrate-binding protein [Actinomycetes bacterium]
MNAVRTRWLAAAVVLALVAGALVWVTVGGSRRQSASTSTAGQTAELQQGGTVTFAAMGDPTGFNPNTSKDGGPEVQRAVTNVYPSVFRTHPDLLPHLDTELMDRAELTAEQPQTVTYRIRGDAVWSDGTPISADDFVYFWEQQNGTIEGNDVPSTAGYQDIGSVTGSPDGRTVNVRFERPYADWPGLFSNLLPSHYVRQQPGGWNTGLDRRPELIPSAGPFRIAGHDRDTSVTLERNPRYWGRPARLDRIILRSLPDAEAQAAAMINGEADIIYPRPQVDLVRRVQGLPGVASQVRFGLSFEHLTFNLRHPILRDLAVREAIALAIDRQQLLERTVGLFSDRARVLGNRIWMVGQQGYQDHAGGYGRGDVQTAAARLEQAGWVEGAGGVRVKNGRRLLLDYITTAGDFTRYRGGELLQDQLAKIGIGLEVRATKTLFDQLPEGGFDIAAFSWVGTPFAVSASRDIYITGGGGNYGRFSDPEVDALFERATAELDPVRSTALANQVDRKLWEGLHSVPLYQRPTFLAWRDTLRNVVENPTSEGPLWNAESWGFAAKVSP